MTEPLIPAPRILDTEIDIDDDASAKGNPIYMTRQQVEEHYDACKRREARIRRLASEEERKGRGWRVFGFFLLVLSFAGIVTGTCLVASAEKERLHGWRQSTCTISRNYAMHNVTEFSNICVYFSVSMTNGSDVKEFCAVPASIAGRGNLIDPPACSNLPSHDRRDIEFWRILAGSESVECLVPETSMIPADRCVAAATTAGPGSAIWRTWLDRFIYLVRDPREATEALRVATEVQRTSGIWVLYAAGFAFLAGIIFTFQKLWAKLFTFCLVKRQEMRQKRRARHDAEHKIT